MATIPIDVKTGDAVKQLGVLEQAFSKVGNALETYETKRKRLVDEGKRRGIADEFTDLNKALSVVGGPLAGLTGRLDDFGDLVDRVGLKSAALNVGMAALASGGITLALAGVTSLAIGMTGLAANSVMVASNFDELKKTLGELNPTIQSNASELEALQEALSGAELAYAALRVEAGGAVAPAVTEATYALTGALSVTTSVVEVTDDATDSWGGLALEMSKSVPIVGGLVSVLHLAALGTGVLAEEGRSAAEELQRLADMDAFVGPPVFDEAGYAEKKRREAEQAAAKARAQREKGAREAAQAAKDAKKWEDDFTKSIVAQTAAMAQQMEAIEKLQAAELKRQLTATPTMQDELAGLPTAQGSAKFSSTFAINVEGAELFTGPMDGLDKLGQKAQETSALVSQEQNAIIQAVGAGVLGFSDLITGQLQDMWRKQGKVSAAERKKQFLLSKNLALTEAGINTALAITSALTVPPPAGYVMAAVSGALGVAQMAVIAAKPMPSAHRGALLPDETYLSGDVVARKNEGRAILTAQAMNRVGGREGIADLNAGRTPRGFDGEATPVFVIEGRSHVGRRYAGPEAGYGQRSRGW